MRILGIDPGYALMGYGIIEKRGNRFSACDYGSVSTEAGEPMPHRLKFLYASLMDIIAEWQPQEAAIEELFSFFSDTPQVFYEASPPMVEKPPLGGE